MILLKIPTKNYEIRIREDEMEDVNNINLEKVIQERYPKFIFVLKIIILFKFLNKFL